MNITNSTALMLNNESYYGAVDAQTDAQAHDGVVQQAAYSMLAAVGMQLADRYLPRVGEYVGSLVARLTEQWSSPRDNSVPNGSADLNGSLKDLGGRKEGQHLRTRLRLLQSKELDVSNYQRQPSIYVVNGMQRTCEERPFIGSDWRTCYIPGSGAKDEVVLEPGACVQLCLVDLDDDWETLGAPYVNRQSVAWMETTEIHTAFDGTKGQASFYNLRIDVPKTIEVPSEPLIEFINTKDEIITKVNNIRFDEIPDDDGDSVTRWIIVGATVGTGVMMCCACTIAYKAGKLPCSK